MLNYGNLNDVEFEYLCQDIMSKILKVDLQRFGSGRDGGVDLTDDSSTYNIVVQAKHYVKTSVSGLLSRLRNEVAKIKKISPNQYYVCCSKELTAENKSEIYNYFSDYMDSPANIITLIEIDDFLAKPENKDILMKHFKLWLDSTNILSEIFTSNIFIDCEALLSDYLYNLNQVKIFERERIYPIKILKMLLQKDICMFYEVNKVIRDFEIFSHILSELDLEDMIRFINASSWIIDEEIKDKYVTIIKEQLEAAIEMYLDNIDADDFAEEIDVDYIIDSNTDKSYNGDDYEENVDTFEVVSEIENKVEELALDEVYRLLNDIPTEYRPDDSKISNMCINVSGAEGVAESHMDYGDYEGHSFSSRGDWNPEIDYIFMRDE